MAIIIRGKSKCSICKQVLSDDQEILMFPHFIAEPSDPFWPFSDSGMHTSCFQSWELAPAFRDAFNRLSPIILPLLKSEWVDVDRFIAGALGLRHPFV